MGFPIFYIKMLASIEFIFTAADSGEFNVVTVR
jgi:hypothetical protein